jgi:acetylornithine deacetylase/succinyl-diaminopimelate desuccinylase-like protein
LLEHTRHRSSDARGWLDRRRDQYELIYGAGPRTLQEANGHRADERVALDDLRLATKTIALALADLLARA